MCHIILNDQSFNGTLTNDIVSFEHLGPDCYDKMHPLIYTGKPSVVCPIPLPYKMPYISETVQIPSPPLKHIKRLWGPAGDVGYAPPFPLY